MEKKLEWKKPVISRVGLDPEQAVLDVCQTGYQAAWINGAAAPYCIGGIQDDQGEACDYGAREKWINPGEGGNNESHGS